MLCGAPTFEGTPNTALRADEMSSENKVPLDVLRHMLKRPLQQTAVDHRVHKSKGDTTGKPRLPKQAHTIRRASS